MTFREFFITNAWWGKFFGAFFGYLTAGPIGALFGLLVGNFFDRGLSRHYSNPHWFYHTEKRKEVQKIFFKSTFSIMGHLAKSSGRVSEQDINTAQMLMDEMQLNNEQKELAKQFFTAGKQPRFNLNAVLAELKKSCGDNRELLKLFIDIQYRTSKASGLTSKKIKVLDVIFSQLGFSPLHQQYRFYEDFGSFYSHEEPKAQSQSSSQSYSSYKKYNYQSSNTNLAHAYALIEVSPDSSKQEVKKAYRRLLSRNHPDKLIAQGLPQEMIKLANEKTHKLVKAYELICSSKGW